MRIAIARRGPIWVAMGANNWDDESASSRVLAEFEYPRLATLHWIEAELPEPPAPIHGEVERDG